jgi:3-methyladenine DNA glycosylase AlkD
MPLRIPTSDNSMSKAQLDSVLMRLEKLGDPKAVEGMARYGIKSARAYGISAPVLRKIAREIGKDHTLAQQLWSTGVLEARILAAFIDEPEKVTEKQMERWVTDFDNWAICDACCSNLFDQTSFAWTKTIEWSPRKEEFVKRAAFGLIAALAVHDKKAEDKQFLKFLPIIKRESTDERNFVKKAINWALRQIGKRSLELNRIAVQTAKEIQKLDSRSAKWIAADALRELTSAAVGRRLKKKKDPSDKRQ